MVDPWELSVRAVLGQQISVAAARRLAERMALALQGALLVQHAPAAVAEAFCTSRLGPETARTYGTLPRSANVDAILDRSATF